MALVSARASAVLAHPGAFALRVLAGFRTNQGLLLAGAVAYYALLSIVPLLLVTMIALSHVVNEGELLDTVGRYLEWLTPGQSRPIVGEIAYVLQNRGVIGWVLLGTMIFFSSLAFSVLEKAMSVIFLHRFAVRRRHFLVSAMLPYCFVLFLGAGLLVVTLFSSAFEALGEEHFAFLGRSLSLGGVSGALFYVLGLCVEVIFVAAIYIVMPVGRLPVQHALIGAVTATVLWELTRRVLFWYFSNLSQVGVVYGSLTTAIVVLLSLEIAATLLLFGAQVISEYERTSGSDVDDSFLIPGYERDETRRQEPPAGIQSE
jgi:membrane protein